MKSQIALDVIRKQLMAELGLVALDEPSRTKAQYFRTGQGKVFGVVLGELVGDQFSAKTTSIILEPCQLPVSLPASLTVMSPYRGSSTYAPGKGVFLKDAQTRVQVVDEHALRALLTWYVTGAAASTTVSPAATAPGVMKPVAAVAPAVPDVPVKASALVAHVVTRVDSRPSDKERKPVAKAVVPDKGLLIKDPWIEKILNGEKTWEMRSRHTHERGWIALIKSGSGMVYGIARIVDSVGELSEAQMLATRDKHGISAQRLSEVPNYRYAWVLADVQRLSKPVPYQHRSGAVIFAHLDDDARAAVAAQIAA